MYTQVLIDHFSNPRNVGVIEDPDGYGKAESPVCGDLMEMYIKVKDGKITDVKYRTFGCAAAIASSSIASEMVMGQSLERVAELSDDNVAAALGGLPDAKIHCSSLAASALHQALKDFCKRHPDECPLDGIE